MMLLTALLLGSCGENTTPSLVAAAKGYIAKGDPAAAVIELKNALQKDPSLAEARFLLGTSLLQTNDVVGAEKELRRALELKYARDDVVPALAEATLSLGEPKRVIDEFGNIELAAPVARARLLTIIGQAQLASGNSDAAGAAFGAALAAAPSYTDALLGQAQLKANGRDLEGALGLVESALATTPKLTEGWQFKGDILVAQGQIDEAMAAYRQALSTKPTYLPAHMVIVSLLAGQGRVEEAKTQLAALQKIAPKHPQTHYLEALVAYKQKDFVAAREAIQQHLQAAPDTLQGLSLAATIDFELKSYGEAEANLRKVIGRAPNSAYPRRMLAELYLRTGKPGNARDVLQPVLDRGTNDPRFLAVAGEVFMRNGQVENAARYFERASALRPDNKFLQGPLAIAHIAQGRTELGFRELEQAAASETGTQSDSALIAAYVSKREFEKALDAIATLEKKQPSSPLPHNLRGYVLLAKNDLAGARASFERALELDPAYIPAATNLARLDLAAGKPQDAKKRFEAVLRKDPKSIEAMLGLAELREREGAPASEVLAMYTKAVATDPTQSTPRQVLIAYHLRHNEPKKAVAAGQEAVSALPDRPELLDALGRAQVAAGDTEQALVTFRNLAKVRPSSPISYLRIADVQIATKNIEAALESLRKALALDPNLLQAQQNIVALEVRAGRAPQALIVARDVQKQRPKESAGFILEGDVHASEKAWKEAIAAYRSGVKQVGTPDLAVRLYAVLTERGSPEAGKFATTWIKDHPKDVFFRRSIAQAAMAKKDYTVATQHYRGLLEVQPDNAVWLNNLAFAAGQQKDPKAFEYAERANKLAPNTPEIMDTLGTLLIERGDVPRGIELLRSAADKAPNEPGIRLNLARGLIKSGQKEAAKEQLDLLAKMGEKFPRQDEVTKLMNTL